MDVLVKGPFHSPTSRGYLANQMLSTLRGHSISCFSFPEEQVLDHYLGEAYEDILDESCMQTTDNLVSIFEEYDCQIVIGSWSECWENCLKEGVNILIGLDKIDDTYHVLSNCYSKSRYDQVLSFEHKAYSDSVVGELELPEEYNFIYPSSFNKLTKEDLQDWFQEKYIDRSTNFVIYYPKTYADPHALASVLQELNLDGLEIILFADALSITELNKIVYNKRCKSLNFGFGSEEYKSSVNIFSIIEKIERLE